MLLAIDPGLKVAGFALFSESQPIAVWSFRPKGPDADYSTAIVQRIQSIWRHLDSVRKAYPAIAEIAIEYTDWHQDLRRVPNFLVSYARERRAQAAISFFVTAVASYCVAETLRFIAVGVSQWHSEIGAQRKDVIAELVGLFFPEKILRAEDGIFWKDDGHKMPDHETDAIGIGHVAFSKLKLEQQIQEIS